MDRYLICGGIAAALFCVDAHAGDWGVGFTRSIDEIKSIVDKNTAKLDDQEKKVAELESRVKELESRKECDCPEGGKQCNCPEGVKQPVASASVQNNWELRDGQVVSRATPAVVSSSPVVRYSVVNGVYVPQYSAPTYSTTPVYSSAPQYYSGPVMRTSRTVPQTRSRFFFRSANSYGTCSNGTCR